MKKPKKIPQPSGRGTFVTSVALTPEHRDLLRRVAAARTAKTGEQHGISTVIRDLIDRSTNKFLKEIE